MPTDLATMRARIVNEIQRPDLEDETLSAILSAVAFFKNRPVVSNQTVTAWTAMVANQREYDLPADFIAPVILQVAADGNITEVKLATLPELLAMDVDYDSPQADSRPLRYTFRNLQFLVWPRPDSATTLYRLEYQSSLAPPVNDADDGFWMEEAERVVRCRAKGILWEDIILMPDKAERQFAHAEAEWKEIIKKLELRVYARGIRPHW